MNKSLQTIEDEAKALRMGASDEMRIFLGASGQRWVGEESVTVGELRRRMEAAANLNPVIEFVLASTLRDANWRSLQDPAIARLSAAAPAKLARAKKPAELFGWAASQGILDQCFAPLRTVGYEGEWVSEVTVFGALTGDVLRSPIRFHRPWLLRWLEDRSQDAANHRLEVESVFKEMSPPAHPALREMWESLLAQHTRGARWTTGSGGFAGRITVDVIWASLRFQGARCSFPGNSETPKLPLSPPFRPICSCGETGWDMCRTRMTILEAMLLNLGGKSSVSWLADLATHMSQPIDERWLGALKAVLGDEPSIPTELDKQPAWFGWTVAVGATHLVNPALVRNYKRPRPDGHVVTKNLPGSEDAIEADLEKEPRDADLYRRWRMLKAARVVSRSGPMEADMLRALVGHPRVYAQHNGTFPVTVEVEEVKLRLSHSDDGHVTAEVVAGRNVLSPKEFLQRARTVSPNHHVELDHERRVVTLQIVPPRVRRAIEVATLMPAQGLPATAADVVRRMSPELTAAGGVELAESLRGTEVPARDHVMAVLELGSMLGVRLRSLPLAGGASMEPGEGVEVVYATTEEGPVHCRRDFHAERMAALQLASRVGLEMEASQEHTWSLPLSDQTLDLVAALQAAEAEGADIRWSNNRPSLGLGKSSQLKVNLKGRRDWFKVDGELTVDKSDVPLSALLAASREGRQWVRVDDGRWVRLEEQLKARIDALADVVGEDDEISPLASSVLADAVHEGVQVAGPAQWLRLTDRLAEARALTPEVPEELTATLRPYQREGFEWLARLAHWSPGAILADDMGLGKTVQALALLLRRQQDGPALVVAPTSLGFNWLRETERFAPTLACVPIRRGPDVEPALEGARASQLLVTSYDLVARHVERFAEVKWATVIFDEAQALKNPATQRAKAATQLETGFALALTGTPLENHTGELWSLSRAVTPGLLGSEGTFRKRFQLPIERGDDRRARRRLASVVAPFILRRLKGQVAQDLPERTDIRLDVTLSRAERLLYEELRAAVTAELESQAKDPTLRFKLLAAITRLRQLACHPRLYLPDSTVPSSKLTMLREKVAELRDEGYRALIFSQFTQLLGHAREALEADGVRCAWLDGTMTPTARQHAVESFQAGEADVFLLSIKAGGTGLNLTAASFVFLLDPWWNPAVETQATDRAHRIGQTEPVTVYRLVALGTIEEAIYALHEEKRALMDAVLAGTGTASSLTPDELRALVLSEGTAADGEDDGAEPTTPERAPKAHGLLDGLPATPDEATELAQPPTPAPATTRKGRKRREPTPAPAPASPTASAPPVPVAPPPVASPPSPAPSAAPAAQPTTPPSTVSSTAPQPSANPEDWITQTLEALERAVDAGEITSGSKGVYAPKIRRMAVWMAQRGITAEAGAIYGALSEYKEAIQQGTFDAPKSDASFASSAAKWLIRGLGE